MDGSLYFTIASAVVAAGLGVLMALHPEWRAFGWAAIAICAGFFFWSTATYLLPRHVRISSVTASYGSIAILVGMIVGGLVFAVAGANGPVVAGAVVVALAIAGNVVSRLIPPVAAGAPDLRIAWNPVPESLRIWRLARKQLAVRNGVLGVSWFWFVGTVLTGNLPAYAELHLGGSQTLYV
uniref:hypothetical protein n=1 Tax=Phenylobacterium sp. TaxID=1871053 RepID=UPI002FCA5E66